MVDDEHLWMRSVEALVRRGKSFVDSLEIADRIAASRSVRARPGLAKCKAPESGRVHRRVAVTHSPKIP
jgi:hypothetical protein